jgi:hypothetical protein
VAKIIIGIHGLGNKPVSAILADWWIRAFKEGLRRINVNRRKLPFELVNWSHFLHPVPLDHHEINTDSPNFIEDPYYPAQAQPKKKPSALRQKVLDYVEKQLDKLMLLEDFSINFSAISDMIIRSFFKDLDIYFNSNCVDEKYKDCLARDAIRQRLLDTLKKNRRRKIILVAHSMGSIIAYDVMMRHSSEIVIDTFLTVGSPLGLPILMQKMAREHNIKFTDKLQLKTPDCITGKWYNFSDLNDRVALNYNLNDDFSANRWGVKPEDSVVVNDFEYDGKKNPHKSFGYLRTVEVAQVIDAFLTKEENPVLRFLKLILNRWRARFAKK